MSISFIQITGLAVALLTSTVALAASGELKVPQHNNMTSCLESIYIKESDCMQALYEGPEALAALVATIPGVEVAVAVDLPHVFSAPATTVLVSVKKQFVPPTGQDDRTVGRFGLNKVTITALTDVTITAISANRGNCIPLLDVKIALKFGQSINGNNGCSDPIEVQIDTDQGSMTFTFPPGE